MKNKIVNNLHKEFKEKYPVKTLHILNGMAMMEYFKSNNLMDEENTYIPFNEAVCWGDVGEEIFSQEFLETRAKSLKSTVDMYKKVVIDSLKPIFQQKFDIIVLWFGDDMFCQINLITILAYLDQIGFEGDVFLSMVEEQKDTMLSEAIELNCDGYKEIYKTILINKEKYTGYLLPVTYEAMNLYLNYKSEKSEIVKYIKANFEDKDLVRTLLKLFPQYGLGDMQYKWIIEEIEVLK